MAGVQAQEIYNTNYNSYNGTSQYTIIPAIHGSSFAFGTGDFCVEAWVYHNGVAPNGGVTTDRWVFGSFTGTPVFVCYLNAVNLAPTHWDGTNNYISVGKVLPNTWTHVAWVRYSGNIYIYINGVSQNIFFNTIPGAGTTASSTNFATIRAHSIGRNDATADRYFPGYISNLRITKGVPVYTANFTPNYTTATGNTSTSLLTLQNTTMIDNSFANCELVSIGGNWQANTSFNPSNLFNSALFNGSSQYISFPTGPLVFGTNAHTIEAWVYPTSFASQQVVISNWAANAPSQTIGSWEVLINTSGQLQYAIATSTTANNTLTSTTAFTLNAWNHFAITNNGAASSVTLYVNGAVGVTSTLSGTIGTAVGGSIGRNAINASGYYSGYISNLRVVNGKNVYNGVFTPQTISPLQIVQPSGANTAAITTASLTTLLVCQNSYLKDRSNNNYTLTNNGAVTFPDVSPMDGFYSVSFDGSSKYLTVPSTGTNAAFTFTGDFTVEGWFYPNSIAGSDRALFCLGTETTNRYVWYILNGGAIGSNLYGASTTTYDVLTATNQAWNHIAIARSGSTVKVYINGVASSTTETQAGTIGNGVLQIGSDSSGSAKFNGYISNFRILKGVAAYTGNFTSRTVPFTAQGASGDGLNITSANSASVSLLTCQSVNIIDNSINNFTITNNGTATTTQSFKPFSFSGSAVYQFNGINDYLSVPASANYAVTASGDFTVECSVFFNVVNVAQTIIDQYFAATTAAGNWQLAISAAGVLQWYYDGSTVVNSSTLVANKWYHIVAKRRNGVASLFVNGVLTNVFASAAVYGQNNTLWLGAQHSTGPLLYMNGYIANVRYINGTSIYDSYITPTSELTLTSQFANASTVSVLTCKSATIIDTGQANTGGTPFTLVNSATPVTATNAVIPFAGTYSYNFGVGTSYLNIVNNAAFIYGAPSTTAATDFTIEGWFYFTDGTTSVNRVMYSNYDTATFAAGIIYWGKHTTYTGRVALFLGTNSTTVALLVDLTLPPNSTWVHYAITRCGSIWTMFRNGVAVATATYAVDPNPLKGICSIGHSFGTTIFNGYISNFRITKGKAIYTNDFVLSPLLPKQNEGTGLQSRTSLYANNVLLTAQSNGVNVYTPVDVSSFAPTVTLLGGSNTITTSAFANTVWTPNKISNVKTPSVSVHVVVKHYKIAYTLALSGNVSAKLQIPKSDSTLAFATQINQRKVSYLLSDNSSVEKSVEKTISVNENPLVTHYRTAYILNDTPSIEKSVEKTASVNINILVKHYKIAYILNDTPSIEKSVEKTSSMSSLQGIKKGLSTSIPTSYQFWS